MRSLKVFLLSFVLMFSLGVVALAQEIPLPEERIGPLNEYPSVTTQAVNLDENIQPEDLEISEPKLLPDSPFYFLKNWTRKIQSFFTINPVRKAELRMKFANEKLMEVKKFVELKKEPKIVKKATENYQQEVEEIKKQVDKIKEKAKENPQVESFLDKFMYQQTLHQKLLGRLETQVPPQAFKKIKEARERHLERFKDVMLKLEDRKEKIPEKLDKILEEQKGSEFKEFKNLEVLKKLEEKVPEETKEAIQKAEEKVMERLQTRLEEMPDEKKEQLKDYIEKISGEKEKQVEIIENIKFRIQQAPVTPIRVELKEKLEEGKTKIIKRMEEKLKEMNCPVWPPFDSNFCQEGRVIIERDRETGCPLPPICIVPGEIKSETLPSSPVSPVPPVPQIPPVPSVPPVPPVPPEKPGLEKPSFCITLWDPVCGINGKTYSNSCFAQLAGVKIAYKGICEEMKKPIETIPEKLPEKPYEVCIQVITPAISPEGICKEFPTPCDVPVDWKIVDRCP